MVWKTVESSVTDVKKAVVKARILTGTYILQKNRQTFSNGTVDAVCRHCRLEEEDLLHLLSRCPSFYSIRESTVSFKPSARVTDDSLLTFFKFEKKYCELLIATGKYCCSALKTCYYVWNTAVPIG